MKNGTVVPVLRSLLFAMYRYISRQCIGTIPVPNVGVLVFKVRVTDYCIA